MRGMRRIAVIAALAVAAETTAWRDIEPDAFAATAYVVVIAGAMAVGVMSGWRGAAVFIPAFAAAAVIEQTWIYGGPETACDPFCSDPTVGLAFVLPFELALVAVGAAARRVAGFGAGGLR